MGSEPVSNRPEAVRCSPVAHSKQKLIVHLFVPYCQRYGYEVIVGRLRADVQLPQASMKKLRQNFFQ